MLHSLGSIFSSVGEFNLLNTVFLSDYSELHFFCVNANFVIEILCLQLPHEGYRIIPYLTCHKASGLKLYQDAYMSMYCAITWWPMSERYVQLHADHGNWNNTVSLQMS